MLSTTAGPARLWDIASGVQIGDLISGGNLGDRRDPLYNNRRRARERMDAIAVSLAGAGALVAIVWLTVRVFDTDRPLVLVIDTSESRPQRLLVVLQRAAGLMAAGVTSGILVLGFGSRLVMRVMAATSADSAQGRLTDAEARVGEVTADGTVTFVLFVGVFSGTLAVGLWVSLRRWFPDRSWQAGLMLAGLGGLLARPSGLINPDNKDFVILSPVWLAMVLSGGLIVLFGVSFAVLADRWAVDWPRLGRTPTGVLAAVPMIAVFGLSALIIVPAVIIALGVCFVAWRRPVSDRTSSWLRASERPGRWVLASVALAGAAWAMVSAVQVLTL